jgi:DDE_Tnp_1-associated/Transposase DDE domain
VPASASLSIAAVADRVGGVALPDPVTLAPSLREALGGVGDPRKRRGVRHGLVVVLSAAVCAVAAGARSFVAVAEWVADLPAEVAAVLGTDRRCPSESTIRRLLGRVDADRFDAAIGAFVQRRCTALAAAGRWRVLAVDGKTLRGSRRAAATGTAEEPAHHLLAVIDQHTRVVLGQVAVTGEDGAKGRGKGSEVSAFAPLMDTLTGLDLSTVVFSADALHTQRGHVEHLHEVGAHWVLTVKGNQCATRRSVTSPLEAGQTRREVCWV